MNNKVPRSSPLTLLERRIWKTVFDIVGSDGKTHEKLRELFESHEFTNFITYEGKDGQEVSKMLSVPPVDAVDSDPTTLGKRSKETPEEENEIEITSKKRGKKSTTKTPKVKSRSKKKAEIYRNGSRSAGRERQLIFSFNILTECLANSDMNGDGAVSHPKTNTDLQHSSEPKLLDYHQEEEGTEEDMEDVSVDMGNDDGLLEVISTPVQCQFMIRFISLISHERKE